MSPILPQGSSQSQAAAWPARIGSSSSCPPCRPPRACANNGSPVGIKAGEKPARLNDLLDAPQSARGTFLGNEEHGVMLVGRLVHRHDQVPFLPRRPFVRAAVLMDHQPRKRRSLTPLAVRPARLGLRPETRFLKATLDLGVTTRSAFLLVPSHYCPVK